MKPTEQELLLSVRLSMCPVNFVDIRCRYEHVDGPKPCRLCTEEMRTEVVRRIQAYKGVSMMLMGSFCIIRCPDCVTLMVSADVQTSADEPKMEVLKCPRCQSEFQIVEDKVTGKTVLERLKKQ